MGIDPPISDRSAIGEEDAARTRRRIGHAGHAEMDVASVYPGVRVVSACRTVSLSIRPSVSLRVHVPHFSWLQIHFSPLKTTEMIAVHGCKE